MTVQPGTIVPIRQAARHVLEMCRQVGLSVGPGGRHGNVLRIAPAMSVTMDEAADDAGILIHARRAPDLAAAQKGKR